jgi:hypothetical protein
MSKPSASVRSLISAPSPLAGPPLTEAGFEIRTRIGEPRVFD